MISEPALGDVFLVARSITKRFAGVAALRGVTLAVRRGEIRCLVGENGSGKSTLIKILAGVERPDSGTIVLDGRAVECLRPADAIRSGIQVIYQDLSLFPNLTVAENLALNALLQRDRILVGRREIDRIAAAAIKRLGVGLDPAALAGELSVADKQLVAIARALLGEARLIIMDEPTAALTGREVARLFSIIRGLKERGVAVLFVSHKLDEVLAISERITVLRSGEAVADGEAAAFDRNSLARHMTGRDVVAPSPPRPRGDAPALLAVTGASRAGSFQDVTFQVGAGEIVGLAGLRGSGRTDLALAIFGLRPLERGSVAVGGIRLALRSPAEAIAAGIAYVPEDRIVEGLFLEQPIGRNVMATILRSLAGRFGLLDRRRARTAVDRWLERLGVACASTEAPVQTLSGGNQQKVVLAKWLAAQARLLIVNGPTVGVDVGAKAEIHALLADIASKGAGMLVLSDDLPELVATAHRILIMHRGRLVDELRGAAEPDLRARLEALR